MTLFGAIRLVEASPVDHPFGRRSDAPARSVFVETARTEGSERSKSSVALTNLRGLVIVIVLAFHSFLAYLGSLGASVSPFDDPPYKWQAFPIVDNHRWFGFDIFCAWQDVYLMSLMFFLSALFTWPSLVRKGTGRFLRDRFQRLGVPFLFAVIVVVPIAEYAAYRVTALDPSLHAYVRHYLALPFWPNGPMWFLWQLLALTVVAAGLHRFAPHWIESLGRWSSFAGTRPGGYFLALAVASALAYVPLALVFTPWRWASYGPFSLQFSRPLLYAVFYVAGLGIGAHGLERGLLTPEGILARGWSAWLAGAFAFFLLWMALTGLGMTEKGGGPFGLRAIVDISFALACTSGCLAAMAGCLRFATRRSRVLDSLANNAFGMYLLHYPFVVWLQYAFLGMALFAIAKAMIVLGVTLLLAWAMAFTMSFAPVGSRLIGVERRSVGAAIPGEVRRDSRPRRLHGNAKRKFPAAAAAVLATRTARLKTQSNE